MGGLGSLSLIIGNSPFTANWQACKKPVDPMKWFSRLSKMTWVPGTCRMLLMAAFVWIALLSSSKATPKTTMALSLIV